MRQAINRYSKLVIALVVVAAAVPLGLFMLQRGDAQVPQRAQEARGWYTIDDGKTWFANKADRVVPFEHEGKQAYRCYVWTCDGGNKKFVSHVERLKASARQHFAGKDNILPWELFPGSLEVKLPLTGERGWVDSASREAAQFQNPRCPDGQTGTPKPVPAE